MIDNPSQFLASLRLKFCQTHKILVKGQKQLRKLRLSLMKKINLMEMMKNCRQRWSHLLLLEAAAVLN